MKHTGPLPRLCGLFSGLNTFFSDRRSKSCNEPQLDRAFFEKSKNGFALYGVLLSCLLLGSWKAEGQTASVTPASLSPSSGMLSTSQTFSWGSQIVSDVAGQADYRLWLGTTGPGAKDLYNSGSTAKTSVTVSIPSNGVTVFATFGQLISGVWQSTAYAFTEPGTMIPATLSPGSGMLSASQTFSWSGGVGPAKYQLLLGTSGVESSTLYNSMGTTATQATVSIPSDGVKVYATLKQLINGVWQVTSYTFNEPGTMTPATLTPSSGTLSTSQTFSWSNGAGPAEYELLLGTTAAGSSNLYNSGVTTGNSATVSIPSNGVTVYATLKQLINDTWQLSHYTLTEPLPTLTLSAASVSFGTVSVGANGSGSVTLSSTGTGPVTVSAGSISGSGYTLSGVSFPLTLNPGQTATLTVGFAPTAAGAVSGAVTLTSNSSSGTTSTISLSGTGQPVLTGLTCANNSFTGAGTDACTVTLNAAAGTGGQSVSVSSNATAVAVPSTVTVAAGATSASFTATISAVTTAQTAKLTATSGNWTCNYSIGLVVPVPTLTLSVTSVSFGTVSVGANGSGSLTLSSTGTGPVTVSAGSISGTGYTLSGATFPLTLNPGQTATLTVGFAPATAGVINGTVTLTSNSSNGTTSTISLSGTGQPVLTGLNCANNSFTGAGTDACTVTLNAAAGTGGQSVSVSSSATAVTVPSTVTVAAGATSASFTATISAVTTAQTATLTAASGNWTCNYAIGLVVPVPTLTLQSTSVAFGDVADGSPSYQSVTLTSSGTAAVTLSAGSVSGTGYTISGVSFPSTLNPGATATLEIEFDPTTAGVANGSVTLTSNSSTGTTSTISLSGTGTASSSYEVNLTWDAPTQSSDPVSGYYIFRAVNGSSTYQQLNSASEGATSYADTTVATNTSYTYYVESVDAEGNVSVPSNSFTIAVP